MDSPQDLSRKERIDVYCPVHHNWIGRYARGSKGSYYCWCKKCKREIEIVMGK